MILARTFAVLAVVLFALAFALALAWTPQTSLADALATVQQGLPATLRDEALRLLPPWVWGRLLLPLLLRPVWLLPAGLGLVAGGAAVTAASHQGPARSRQHRG